MACTFAFALCEMVVNGRVVLSEVVVDRRVVLSEVRDTKLRLGGLVCVCGQKAGVELTLPFFSLPFGSFPPPSFFSFFALSFFFPPFFFFLSALVGTPVMIPRAAARAKMSFAASFGSSAWNTMKSSKEFSFILN